MSYFETIYAAELPHRAVAVYMYLRDRSNGDKPSGREIAIDVGLQSFALLRCWGTGDGNHIACEDGGIPAGQHILPVRGLRPSRGTHRFQRYG